MCKNPVFGLFSVESRLVLSWRMNQSENARRPYQPRSYCFMQTAQLDVKKADAIDIFEPIQAQLQQVEARMREMTVIAHPALVSALQYLLQSGGKRARPAVTLLTGDAMKAPEAALIDLAGAVELLHTASLVHDDIIDGALLRRGVSTLNATWSPGATILTGDFIFARAAQLAAATGSVRVMSLFAQCLMTICNGELNQLFEGRSGERERQAYYDRIYAKTASLFSLAGEAAAVLATDDEGVIAEMRRFGEKLGMAFQIVDDILDFVGKETAVGKPLGSDLRQGLVTLPTLYFLEQYPEDDRVVSVLNGHKRDPERLAQALAAVRESEAISLALAEARDFVNEARRSLRIMPASSQRDALESLAEYIVARDL